MTESSLPGQPVPVKSGLYETGPGPEGHPHLVASRCSSCGELFFPRRKMCQNCQSESLESTGLSSRGRIFSYTVVMQRPPSNYLGPVPYAFGWVELPDGIRVETLFTGCRLEDLRIGMAVEMVIETLHTDSEGREIVCHKFKPVEETA
jgi:uncharacterized OB-fold protein